MSQTTPFTLTAELLLLLHDTSGKPLVGVQRRRVVSAGAAVAELVLDEVLVLDRGVPPRRAKLWARDGATPPAYLVDALGRADGRRPKDAVARIGGGQTFRKRSDDIRDAVMADLARAGIVEAVEARVFAGPRWPTLRPEVRDAVRGRLRTVLDGGDPTPRDASLLALAHAGRLLPRLYPERHRKADARRVAEVAGGDWCGEAVSRALAELTTVMASGAAVGAMGGGS